VSKYVVFATILLLTLSSTASIALASSPFLCTNNSSPATCTAVDTHGPRVGIVPFVVVGSDASLKSDLLAGTIQGPEWTFTVTSYNALPSCSTTVCKGSTGTYEFDGVAFQTTKPYMNNVLYRQAIAYLTSYANIETDVCSGGVACTAEINLLPCAQYPGACFGAANPYTLNVKTNAYNDLAAAGLTPYCGTSESSHSAYVSDCALGTNSSDIANWYVGAGDTAGGLTCSNTDVGVTASCVFSPLFYYRSDDPLRTEVATLLCTSAASIGLHMTCTGITDADAGGDIYGAAASSVIAAGAEQATGFNTAPVYNSTIVNGTASVAATDTWDMYTYGWITSAYYTWPLFFFNTAFASSDNFVEFYNTSMDYYTNNLIYTPSIGAKCTSISIGCDTAFPVTPGMTLAGSSCSSAFLSCGAAVSSTIIGNILMQQLPYLNSFYENQLYAVYTNGWTGYANIPSTGPGTGVGIYYNLFNVHSTSPTCKTAESPCGSYTVALHSVADVSGLNPLYNTEWVWQADIWGEVYDGPLGTIPTQATTPNVFLNFQTTSYSAAGYTGTPSGSGVWFTPGESHAISGGEVVTLNFRNNITWTDNVPLTAYDYNFSLAAWDITGCTPSCATPAITPLAYALSGPEGVIATQVTSNTQIKIYIGSDAVWNLASINVPTLPEHILGNFNLGRLATSTGAVDLTQRVLSTSGNAASSPFCSTGCLISDPTYMQYLPNLEVGSGPFYLYAYSQPPSGAGELKANFPNYQRTSWLYYAAMPSSAVKPSTDTPFSTAACPSSVTGTTAINCIGQWVLKSPTGSATEVVPITNKATTGTFAASAAKVTYSVCSKGVSGCGSKGSKVVLTGSMTYAAGKWSASLNTKKLTAGDYEIVVTATYTFQGLARTWIGFYGIDVK